MRKKQEKIETNKKLSKNIRKTPLLKENLWLYQDKNLQVFPARLFFCESWVMLNFQV